MIFKCFLKIVKRNLPIILMYIMIHLMITVVIVTRAQKNQGTNIEKFKSSDSSVAVFDKDNSELSKAMKQYIEQKYVVVKVNDNVQDIQDSLFYNEIQYAITIPKGYGEKICDKSNVNNLLIESITVPGSTNGIYVDMQIQQYLRTIRGYLFGGFDVAQAQQMTMQTLDTKADINLIGIENPDQDSIKYFYQVLPYVTLSILLLGAGPVLMAFNKDKIVARNNSSCLTLTSKNLQLTLGMVIFTIIFWFVFLLLAIGLYGAKLFTTSSLIRLINFFVMSIVSMACAYLVGTVVKNRNILNAVTNVISLGICFISGVFVPMEYLSSLTKTIGQFSPFFWYIKVNNTISQINIFNINTLKPIIQGVLVQALFAIAIFVVTLLISHFKRVKRFV